MKISALERIGMYRKIFENKSFKNKNLKKLSGNDSSKDEKRNIL